jgi:DNA-directed RNA polymerase subunit beta'
VDNLVGLKENVILGHLIPAGTGFRTFQDAEVRYRPEALKAMAADKERALVTSFPLLQSPDDGDGNGASAETMETEEVAAESAEAAGAPSQQTAGEPGDALDTLFGGGDSIAPPDELGESP